MVTIQVKKSKSIFEKMKGVIGDKTIEPFLLKTRFGIHTFGVRAPIDVVVLDSNNVVVTCKTVKPNRVFFWNPCFDTILELPNGTIKKQHLHVGSTLTLITR